MVDFATLDAKLAEAPIVPVLTIENADHAAALGSALEQGGITAVEVTLRTDAAIDSIKEMKAACPNLIIGVGTVLSKSDLDESLEAGADFIVTPGSTAILRDAGIHCGKPFIPGVATPSEAMACLELGLTTLKLFPAEIVGGTSLLKAMSGPLSQLRFMPTGGVTTQNLTSYLGLKNVICVGGTWLAKSEHVTNGDWDGIRDRCRAALEIAGAK